MNPIIEKYNRLYIQRGLLIKEQSKKKRKLRHIKRDILDHEKARILLTEVGKQIQSEIKTSIENLLTLGIRTVFDRPLTFKLIYEEKRNQIEARPVVLEGENEYTPKDDMGGGILDIISISFRIVLWQLSNPRIRNLFILDEPFKFTGVLIKKAGELLRYLSQELNFQVIIVSHDEELIEMCDRVYKVSHNGTESIVKLIKEENIEQVIQLKAA